MLPAISLARPGEADLTMLEPSSNLRPQRAADGMRTYCTNLERTGGTETFLRQASFWMPKEISTAPRSKAARERVATDAVRRSRSHLSSGRARLRLADRNREALS